MGPVVVVPNRSWSMKRATFCRPKTSTCLQLGRVIKITGADGCRLPRIASRELMWKLARTVTVSSESTTELWLRPSLAGFLLQEPQNSDAQRSDALRMIEIIVTDFPTAGTCLSSTPKRSTILLGSSAGAMSRQASQLPTTNGPCSADGERR